MVIDLAALPLVVPSTVKPPKGRDGLHHRRRHWYYCLKIKGRRHYFTTKAQDYQEARRVYAAARKDQEKAEGLPKRLNASSLGRLRTGSTACSREESSRTRSEPAASA